MPRKKPNETSEAPLEAPKQPVLARKLSDLAPRQGVVVVERPDGQDDLAIPYRELTYKRYWEIGRLVDDPLPLKVGQEHDDFAKDENGKLVKVYKVDWYNWQRERLDAENKRTLWRLVEFVDLEFEGATPEARIEELQNTLPNDIVQALTSALRGLVIGSESRVETRAGAFLVAGHRDNGSVPADGLDSRVLADAE